MEIPSWFFGAVGTVGGFAVAFGTVRATVNSIQTQMEKLSEEIWEVRQIVANLRDSVSRLQAFHDAEKKSHTCPLKGEPLT